jgi:hypothetical protein
MKIAGVTWGDVVSFIWKRWRSHSPVELISSLSLDIRFVCRIDSARKLYRKPDARLLTLRSRHLGLYIVLFLDEWPFSAAPWLIGR